jgi:hypothetical protein
MFTDQNSIPDIPFFQGLATRFSADDPFRETGGYAAQSDRSGPKDKQELPPETPERRYVESIFNYQFIKRDFHVYT